MHGMTNLRKGEILMNETYEMELQMEINFLYEEISYLQTEIMNARKEKDTKQYAALMRVFLPMQKSYLKMCADLEKLTGNTESDPLLSFAESAPGAV